MAKIKGIFNFYALLSLGCYRASSFIADTKLSRRGYDVRVSQLCLSEKSLPETAESLFPAKDVTHRKSSQSKSAILEQIFYSVDETRSNYCDCSSPVVRDGDILKLFNFRWSRW